MKQPDINYLRVLVRALPLMAVIYLLGPLGLQIRSSLGATQDANTVTQVSTKSRGFNQAERSRLADLARAWEQSTTAPIGLAYHDVSEKPASPYTVTPSQLDEQMKALTLMGAHVLSAAEMVAYQAGGTVPPKSVFITFDDGARGVWKYADRILKRYKFRAVAFVITGSVGTRPPYYMTWNELEQLGASGRWDIEAHTHLGHRKIPTSSGLAEASFLSNLEWRADQRLETLDEYRIRMTVDLDACQTELVLRGHGKHRLFAYPFSDFGATSNEPATAGVLSTALAERFAVAFTTGENPSRATSTYNLNRITIKTDTDVVSLTNKILRTAELNPTRTTEAVRRP